MRNNYKVNFVSLLIPVTDNNKSYYGKAIVKSVDNGVILQSYDTDVCACIDGRFIRLWSGYSATTMKHINSFAANCGIREGGKKWWDSLPVERF